MSQRSEKNFRIFAGWLLSGVSKLLFGTRKHVYDMPEKGSLILCNHTSIWDFSYMCYAMRPHTNVHFVVTGIEFDKSRLRSWLFKNLGIIRKTQGAVDVMCVKEIIKAIRSGDNVAIYAAGMTSYDGREGWTALNGTGSLARMLKCPVYTAVTEGGFISCPRYTTRRFRGHVDISLRRICTGENMSADDYQKEIDSALRFNDWDWQERNNVPFRGIRRFDGTERILYMCPSCRELGHMTSSKNKITCGKCGFTATRDKYGFFISDNKACPRRMDKWADMEIEEANRLVESGKLDFVENAAYVSGDAPVNGKIRLTNEGISFEAPGTKLSWGIGEFQFLIFNDKDLLTFHTGSTQHRFRFENPALMYRWFFAHRCLVNPGYLKR